jgi:hypothetical protein
MFSNKNLCLPSHLHQSQTSLSGADAGMSGLTPSACKVLVTPDKGQKLINRGRNYSSDVQTGNIIGQMFMSLA